MTRAHTPTDQQFVINLCTLAAPITVPQPRASRLTRYTFFLSRAWIGGQRQYQLNMGYFPTSAEAEKWLDTLKRVYPNACVSEAPEAQPDLMSNTQALRILNIGQIGDSEDQGREIPISGNTRSSQSARGIPAPDGLPASRELFVRDTGTYRRVRKGAETLEDTLNELRNTREFDMANEDDLEGTGVRHLRIESAKG